VAPRDDEDRRPSWAEIAEDVAALVFLCVGFFLFLLFGWAVQ
jgi:hypothetical protein